MSQPSRDGIWGLREWAGRASLLINHFSGKSFLLALLYFQTLTAHMKVFTKKTFVYFLLGSFLAFISLFSACSDKDKNVAVTGVSLDVTSDLALNVGESRQLTATVAPANADDKTVTWSSNDATRVTVDQAGNVKAIAAGEAVVKAKAGDKESSLKVTVIAVPVLVWSPAGDHSARAGSAPFTKTAAVSGAPGCNAAIAYSIVPVAGVASVNAATGEVTPAATIAGSAVAAVVTAVSAAVTGVCTSATASYTLTITAPPAPVLTWSPAGNTHSVRAGSEPFTKTVTASGCNAAIAYSIVPVAGVASINAATGRVTPVATITGDQVTALI